MPTNNSTTKIYSNLGDKEIYLERKEREVRGLGTSCDKDPTFDDSNLSGLA